MPAQLVRASSRDLRDQFDGRAARPAAMVAAPPATPARSATAKRGANASRRPVDPALEGMGRAPAQAAYLFYRTMGPKRSLRKMAEVYQEDRGTLISRRRSFERWSSRYGWVEKAEAWDADLAEHEHERRRQAVERMDDSQADAMGALWQAMRDCVYELLRLDQLDRHAYYEVALANWHTLAPETRAKQQPPRPPRERVGAYAAALLMRLGLEYERLARGSALAATEEAAAARAFAPPPVFEVCLTDQPPADPVDPFEDD